MCYDGLPRSVVGTVFFEIRLMVSRPELYFTLHPYLSKAGPRCLTICRCALSPRSPLSAHSAPPDLSPKSFLDYTNQKHPLSSSPRTGLRTYTSGATASWTRCRPPDAWGPCVRCCLCGTTRYVGVVWNLDDTAARRSGMVPCAGSRAARRSGGGFWRRGHGAGNWNGPWWTPTRPWCPRT
jgi:hypothetical protein